MSDSINNRFIAALNKTLVDPVVRSDMASLFSRAARNKSIEDTIQVTPSDQKFAEEMRQRGLTRIGTVLSESDVESVQNHISECSPNIDEGGFTHYPLDAIVNAPCLLAAAASQRILSLCQSHLEAPPIIVNLQLWKSTANPGPPTGNQIFHRDREGFRSCKFFVYLSPVDEANGAQEYVIGSHNVESTIQLLGRHGLNASEIIPLVNSGARATPETVSTIFGDKVFSVCGPAGFAFMTNNYGLHRGKPLQSGSRWLFAADYTVSDQRRSIDALGPVWSPAIDALRKTSPAAHHALQLFGKTTPSE